MLGKTKCPLPAGVNDTLAIGVTYKHETTLNAAPVLLPVTFHAMSSQCRVGVGHVQVIRITMRR